MYGYIKCFFTIFIIQTNTIQCVKDGVVQEQYNIFLKDNDDLKVDLDLSEDNYEIINTHPTNEQKIIKEKLSEEFNENRADARIKDKNTKSIIMVMDDMIISNVRLSQTRKRDPNNENVEYVEHDLESEQYDDAISDAASTYGSLKVEKSDSELLDSLKVNLFNNSYNGTEQELKGVFVAIKYFVKEFYSKQHYESIAKHFWKIAAIWVAVYLVIAVPLWFTRGWCSCCLCCKFFKPQQTIQEAKNYLLLNPPGILVAKTGIIPYEPTEREKDCYEEFAHFLRTL